MADLRSALLEIFSCLHNSFGSICFAGLRRGSAIITLSGCNRGRDNGSPAEWAIHMRLQPRVNAPDVEGMTALGKKSEELPVIELAKADGTVTVIHRTLRILPELQHGDRVDNLLIEPHCPDVPGMVVPNIVVTVGQVVAGEGPNEAASAASAEGGSVAEEDDIVDEEEEDYREGGGDGEGKDGQALVGLVVGRSVPTVPYG